MTYIPPYYKGMGTRYKTKKSQVPVPVPVPVLPPPALVAEEPALAIIEASRPTPIAEPIFEAPPVVEEYPQASEEVSVEAREEIPDQEESHSDDVVPTEVINKIVANEEVSDEEKELFVAYINLEGTSKGALADISDRMGVTLNKKKMNKNQMVESIKSRL